jgi:hypothetical protein
LLCHFFHRAHHFWRNVTSEIESLCFDPEYPQALRKNVKNASQFYRFGKAESVSRYRQLQLRRNLSSIPDPHFAGVTSRHHRIHDDYVIGPIPCLDERQSLARADLGFHTQFPQALCDHYARAVIASIPIPAADDQHGSVLADLFTLHDHF